MIRLESTLPNNEKTIKAMYLHGIGFLEIIELLEDELLDE